MYVKRSWDLRYKSMRSKWREHAIYMKRAYDLHEESMGSLEESRIST